MSIVTCDLAKALDSTWNVHCEKGNCSFNDVGYVALDIFTATYVWREAESAATGLCALWAVAPAYWAFAVGTILTRCVAQARVVLLLRRADLWSSYASAV